MLLLSLTFALAAVDSVPGQGKPQGNADSVFLTKVVPGIAASVRIIDYAAKNAVDEKVKDLAERVAKQHKESVKTAGEHAKRLKIKVVSDPEKDSKEVIDKLAKLKGADLDVAFLQWLSRIHVDTTVFDNEIKNGIDADLKSYAKISITVGNEHLKEARALLVKVKK
jgi:predicted outer membrane protein